MSAYTIHFEQQYTTSKAIMLILAMLFSSSIIAQSVSVSTNRATAYYEADETATFNVTSTYSSTATYTLYYDKFTIIEEGTIQLNANQITEIPFTNNEPGMVMCKVKQGVDSTLAVAAFAPFDIEPYSQEPADFDEFWDKQKERLNGIPLDPNLVWYSDNEYSTTYKVDVSVIDGRRVYGYITIPDGDGPFPAFLTLPSYGTNPSNIIPTVALSEFSGAIGMTISIHNAPLDQEDVGAYLADNICDPDSMYYRYSMLAGIRALDYIFSRPDFNGTEIGLQGVSQGGGLSLMLAGIDNRVNLLGFSNPSNCEHAGLREGKASGFPYFAIQSYSFYGNVPGHLDATYNAASYYDAAFFARRYDDHPVSFFISYKDEITPAATQFTAFNQLRCQKILMHSRDLDHGQNPFEYWNERFAFFRRYYPSTQNPPFPWGSDNLGYHVYAGDDAVTDISSSLTLTGTLEKDDVINPDWPLEWQKVEGPGEVTFNNANAYSTGVSFSEPGVYVLSFSGHDYALLNDDAKYVSLFDYVTVTVQGQLVDTTNPTVTLSSTDNVVYAPFQVTVTFDEPVTGLALSDFNISNGTPSNLSDINGNGHTYTFTITPITYGNLNIRLPVNRVVDEAGNGNIISNLLVVTYADNVQPNVVLSTSDNDIVAPFTVNVDFDEDINGLTLGDFTVSNGTLSNLSGSGQNYTLMVSPDTYGDVCINLPANKVVDDAGNNNTGSNSLCVSYIDDVRPSVQLSTAATEVTAPFDVTISFSEPISGFTLGDITVNNGEASNLNGNGNNTIYTVTITPSDYGMLSVFINANKVVDNAGNNNTNSNTLSINYIDAVAPEVVLTSPNVVFGPFIVNINFSENISGFNLNDITVVNGTAQSITGGNPTYEVTIIPENYGLVSISIAANRVQDQSGNGNIVSNQLGVTYMDIIAPTPVLSTATNIVAEPFVVNLEFDEDITGLELSDFSISNCSLSDLNGSGASYTFLATPENYGLITIVLSQGLVEDSTGNGNDVSNVLEVNYVDDVAPNPILSTANAQITSAFTVDINFNESITGLSLDDFNVNNCTLSDLSGSGSDYSFLVTPINYGLVTINLAENLVEDEQGNGNLASNILEVDYIDDVAPNPTLSTANSQIASAFTVNISFSETITGLSLGDFSVDNCTLSALTGSGSGYSFLATPVNYGLVTISLAENLVEDEQGNGNLASNILEVTYVDDVAPNVTLSTANTTVDGSFDITVTFSEDVDGLIADDFEVTNGEVQNIDGQNSAYTITINPFAIGNVSIFLPEDKASDSAGNGNLASNELTVTYEIETSTSTLSNADISIYPNPNKGIFFIDLSHFSGQSGSLVVHNTLGQLVHQQDLDLIPSTPLLLDLNSLSDGCYHVLLKINGEDNKSQKIIINKS